MSFTTKSVGLRGLNICKEMKMEEKDEFSDILLEQDGGSKGSKFKKIVLVIGIFVLIFLIVLLVMKLLNSSEVQNGSENLTTSSNEIKDQDDSSYKQVPIIQEDDNKQESFEQMVKKLKEKELQRAKEEEVVANDTKELPEVTKQDVTPPAKNQIAKKPVAKKRVVKKPKKQTKKKSIPKIFPPNGATAQKGIYIQISASLKSKPDARFISKIRSKNYRYRLYETRVKGKDYLKILVGPYKSLKDARANIQKVRRDLNPKAFVFRVK